MQYNGAEPAPSQVHALYPRELMQQQELAKASSAPLRLGDLDAFGCADELVDALAPTEFCDERSASSDLSSSRTSFDASFGGFDRHGDAQMRLTEGAYEHGGAAWSEPQQHRGLEQSVIPGLPEIHVSQSTGSFFEPHEGAGQLEYTPGPGLFAEGPLQWPMYQPQYQQLHVQLQRQGHVPSRKPPQQPQFQPQHVLIQRAARRQSSRERPDMTTFLSQFRYVEPIPKPEMHGASEVWIARDSEE